MTATEPDDDSMEVNFYNVHNCDADYSITPTLEEEELEVWERKFASTWGTPL